MEERTHSCLSLTLIARWETVSNGKAVTNGGQWPIANRIDRSEAFLSASHSAYLWLRSLPFLSSDVCQKSVLKWLQRPDASLMASYSALVSHRFREAFPLQTYLKPTLESKRHPFLGIGWVISKRHTHRSHALRGRKTCSAGSSDIGGGKGRFAIVRICGLCLRCPWCRWCHVLRERRAMYGMSERIVSACRLSALVGSAGEALSHRSVQQRQQWEHIPVISHSMSHKSTPIIVFGVLAECLRLRCHQIINEWVFTQSADTKHIPSHPFRSPFLLPAIVSEPLICCTSFDIS